MNRGYLGLRYPAKEEWGDAIVLAGTDLALVFNSSNTDFPFRLRGTAHSSDSQRLLDRVTTGIAPQGDHLQAEDTRRTTFHLKRWDCASAA
jgi:hypothetical protein